MNSDLRRRLARANDLAPPDLWDEALTRARLGARPIPTIPPSSSAWSRVVAGAVAFVVFLLAGAFAWMALRPPGDGIVGSGGPAHQTIAVLEPSGSMLPTIEIGQTVVVDVDAYDGTTPSRGDIVAFTVADYPDLVMLKRVIGLPGDTVEQVEGVVKVNGEALDEPYVVHDKQTLGPWTVEPGHLFVMGDNRPDSNDSRFSMGQIASSDLTGQVLLDEVPRVEAPAPLAPTVSGPSPSGTSGV